MRKHARLLAGSGQPPRGRPRPPFPPHRSLSFSLEGARAERTISGLHARWILIEAQRIKLLKIRLSLLVVPLFLLLLDASSSRLPPSSDLRPFASRCEIFFIPVSLPHGYFINSYDSRAKGTFEENYARAKGEG